MVVEDPSPSRPEVPGRGTAWRAAPYVAAVLVGSVLVAYLVVWGRTYGLDLHVYRDSAAAALHGHDPYRMTFTGSALNFTYPPFALAFLTWTTVGSFAAAQWLLWVLSIAAGTASVVIVLRDRGYVIDRRLWCWSFVWTGAAVFVLEPARSGTDYGQIEFLLMFLVVVDLLAAPRAVRGLVVGLASAVKLTPLFFVVVFVVRRDWWSAVRAGVGFAVCTCVAWLAWPELSRTYWVHKLVHTSRIGPAAYPSNQSWFAILHRPPFPVHGSDPLWAAMSLVTVVVGVFVAWRCATTDRQAFCVLSVALTGLLVSPISWSHHWVWVLLIPPMLVGPRRGEVASVVRAMLWTVVALAAAAPYWWLSSGWLDDALEAVLPVWTLAVLVTWSVIEYRRWRVGRELPAAPLTPMVLAGARS